MKSDVSHVKMKKLRRSRKYVVKMREMEAKLNVPKYVGESG